MSRKNIFILFILFSLLIGVGVFLIVSSIRTQDRGNTAPVLENSVQKATQEIANLNVPKTIEEFLKSTETTGEANKKNQDLQEEARRIDPYLNKESPVYSSRPYSEELFQEFKDQKSFDLLGGAKVYVVSNFDISSTALLNRIPAVDITSTCMSACSIVVTKDTIFYFSKNIRYVSSFEKAGRIYWILISKEIDGYTLAYITNPDLSESKKVRFTEGFISEIEEKSSNLGTFTFIQFVGNSVYGKTSAGEVNFKDQI
jgi:hypothetical protein